MNEEYNYKNIKLVENSQKAQKLRKLLKIGTFMQIVMIFAAFYYLFIFELLPYTTFNSQYEIDQHTNKALLILATCIWITSLVNTACLLNLKNSFKSNFGEKFDTVKLYINYTFVLMPFVLFLLFMFSLFFAEWDFASTTQ
jgi:hypothetical protein